MTTSGQINGQITARQIMTLAMQDLGVRGSGETPSAEEYQDMRPRLNWLLKTLQSQGANLWRTETGTITIPAGSVSGALDPRVIDVIAARIINNDIEIPLQGDEQGQYATLPNKSQPGRPTIFWLDMQRDQVNFYVWPVPYQDTEVKLDYARVIEDVTDPNETLDVPQAWAEAVWTNLAVACATMFGAARLDPQAVALVTERASNRLNAMLDMDRPASVFMGSAYGSYF